MKLFHYEFGPIRISNLRDYFNVQLRKSNTATFGFYATEHHSQYGLGWFNIRIYFCVLWWSLIVIVVRRGKST